MNCSYKWRTIIPVYLYERQASFILFYTCAWRVLLGALCFGAALGVRPWRATTTRQFARCRGRLRRGRHTMRASSIEPAGLLLFGTTRLWCMSERFGGRRTSSGWAFALERYRTGALLNGAGWLRAANAVYAAAQLCRGTGVRYVGNPMGGAAVLAGYHSLLCCWFHAILVVNGAVGRT